jgi:FKBP-type peptidyl-prolyl cis-trans isomerase FkpA
MDRFAIFKGLLNLKLIMKKYIFSLFAFSILILSSCLKSKDPVATPDPHIQLGKDTVIIKKFISDNAFPAIKYGETGIYYQIKAMGTGDTIPQSRSFIKFNYEGRFLNGTIFHKLSSGSTQLLLGSLIPGLQLGIPLLRKGGKMRIIIPSGYAYDINGTQDGLIPPNTILDFDIELLDVN